METPPPARKRSVALAETLLVGQQLFDSLGDGTWLQPVRNHYVAA